MRQYKVGDYVQWESQSMGSKTVKIGMVVCIMPTRARPHDLAMVYPNHNIQFDRYGFGRYHESYIVEVSQGKAKPKLYWPLVKNLREAGEVTP